MTAVDLPRSGSAGAQAEAADSDPRRAFLLQALALGWLAGGAGWLPAVRAGVLGERPSPLPAGRSIFSIDGEVWVDGRPATRETLIGDDALIRTGAGATLVAVVGAEALILRGNTELQLGGAATAKRFFRLVSGAMLAVFGRRERTLEIHAPTVTVGVRGTGVYTEAGPERSYVCTCYGRTRLAASGGGPVEDILARHHDAPRWVLARPDASGRRIVPAEFLWHTDLELMTLEALVGREVPFQLEAMEYRGPRRDY